MALAGDPVHPLRPHRDAALFSGVPLEQLQIEFAAFEVAPQKSALVRPHVEPQARPRAAKRRQQFCQAIGREIFGNAEPNRALIARPRQHVAGFFGQRQQPSCIGQQPFAGFGRRYVLAVAVQQRLPDIGLQPLDLLADGRLRAMNAFPGAGKTAGIHHRNKAAQQFEIEHGGCHLYFHWMTVYHLIYKYQGAGLHRNSKENSMSLAPSIRPPRATFNPLPIYIGLFCVLWSFAFVAGKIGVTACPPLILLTARFSLAGILILGISALRRDAWSLSWRDAWVFAVLGVANNALYLGLGYTGLQTVSAGLGGLVVSANPVFTAGLAALFLGEALTWRKVAGLSLGIAGVSFIVWHRMSVGTDSWHGILFTLASLASIVAGTILFKLLAPKGSLWIGNGVQNLAAGIVLLPFAFTLADAGDVVPSTRLFGAFAFLVLGGSILAYRLWFHLLKVCGATAASAYHFLMPPLAMLFAWMVLGEHVEVRDLMGIVPVALGIYLVTRPAAASAQ